jgi:hypothetical protein
MLLCDVFTFHHGWQSFFPVGRLGVEDQEWSPRIPDFTACDYFFLGGGGLSQRGSSPIRTKNTWWTGTPDSRYLCRCFSWLAKGKVLSPPLAGSWSAQNTGAYAEIWHWSASVWALKWSKNCCTSPFSFRIYLFNIVFTNHSAYAITYFGCTLFLVSRCVKETWRGQPGNETC